MRANLLNSGARLKTLSLALGMAFAPVAWGEDLPASIDVPSAASMEGAPAQLTLAVRWDGHDVPGRLEAQADGGNIYLPLGALAKLLSLPIVVRPELGRASGFVLSDELNFDVDVATSTVRIGGREKKFDPRYVIVMRDDLYVSTRLLARWLRFDMSVDLPSRLLDIMTNRGVLPPAATTHVLEADPNEPPTPPPIPPDEKPTPLRVLVEGQAMPQKLNTYRAGQKVLLPLRELARMLTLSITVSPEQGSARGSVLSGAKSLDLDVGESTVWIGGREQHFDPRCVTVIGDDIYVSSIMLSHWLPVDLDADLTKGELRVKPQRKLPVQERMARSLETPLPSAPPVLLHSAPLEQGPAQPMAAQPTGPTGPASFGVPAPTSPLPKFNAPRLAPRNLEANLVILELRLDGHLLSDGFNAYLDGQNILLPLGELTRLLTLGINVQPEKGTANGFVVREDHTFSLNLADSTVGLSGHDQIFESQLATVIGDDIYVSKDLLAHWLPLDLDISLPTLQMKVMPRQKLPLQERLARESNSPRPLTTVVTDLGYPHVDTPLKLFGVPFIDQTLGTAALVGHSERRIEAEYTAYLTGDLLGMEGAAYVSSSRKKISPDIRVTLSRHDPEAGLLGPLKARSVAIGSVTVPTVPNVVAGSPQGYGATASNHPIDQPTSFDTQTLRGPLPPGWDVTLYYNDALLAYQQSRPDGQYSFEDLPLSFGPNDFRLVFNGPLGQVRVERQSYLLDQSIVRPGELLYSLAHQQAKSGEQRSVAQVDFGLTKEIAVNAAVVRKPVLGSTKEHGYMQFGARGYWDTMITGAQLTAAQSGGSLLDLNLKTKVGPYAVDMQHLQRMGAFQSDVLAASGAALRYRDKIRMTGTQSRSGAAPISMTLEAVRDALKTGSSNLGVQGRVSTFIRGTSISNSLHWQKTDGMTNLDGSLQLSRRMLDIGVNAQLDYRLHGGAAFQAASISADRTFEGGYRVNVGVQHTMYANPLASIGPLNATTAGLANAGLLQPKSAGQTLFSAGLSKSLGRFGVALTGSYSTTREAAIGLQLFMAMGQDPRSGAWSTDAQPLAGSGAISARAFVDKNQNGVRDEGEEFVPNAGFILNGSGRHPVRTDDTGVAFIGHLLPSQYTDISLDASTLEDPQWRPVKPGYRVLPRPGLVDVIEFPVIATTEIDGTVYLTDKNRRRGIGDAHVELIDDKGMTVDKTTSSPDGYYLFHQVFPGRYRLRIAPEQAATLHLGGGLERPMLVPSEGDFINGQDFELTLPPR